MVIDWDRLAETMVPEMREVAASNAAAAILVQYRYDEDTDEAEHGLVCPNQRDPVAGLKTYFRGGYRPIGVLVCTDDGQGRFLYRGRIAGAQGGVAH